MQIAPVGAMEVALANLAVAMATQQQIGVGAVAQPKMLGAAQEKHAVAKAMKADRNGLTTSARQERVAQNTLVTNSANPESSAKTGPAQPITERQLFDYLAEVERSGAGQRTDPLALAKDALHSLGGAMEQFQSALGKRKVSGSSEVERPSSVEDATPEQEAEIVPASATKDGGAQSWDGIIEKMLEQYVSVSWAVFGASLATSSVSAATASVNSLVKQQ